MEGEERESSDTILRVLIPSVKMKAKRGIFGSNGTRKETPVSASKVEEL